MRTKDLFERGDVVKTNWKQSSSAIFARRTATGSKRAARSRLLLPEISRCDAKTRDFISSTIRDVVSIIAAELPSFNSKQDALVAAYAIYGLMIGTVQVARLTRSAPASEAIVRAAREAALQLARCKD